MQATSACTFPVLHVFHSERERGGLDGGIFTRAQNSNKGKLVLEEELRTIAIIIYVITI